MVKYVLTMLNIGFSKNNARESYILSTQYITDQATYT